MLIGARTEAWGGKSSRLPPEFQEVEYIERTGNKVGRFYFNIAGSVYNDARENVVKYRDVYSFANFNSRIVVGYEGENFNHYISISNGGYAQAGGDNLGYLLSPNTKYEIECSFCGLREYGGLHLKYFDDSGNLLVQGNNTSYIGWYIDTDNYHIFESKWDQCHAPNGSRYYGSTITINNLPAGVIVPCFRKLDNAVGVFNLVDSTFWPSSGGVICGPNI